MECMCCHVIIKYTYLVPTLLASTNKPDSEKALEKLVKIAKHCSIAHHTVNKNTKHMH